VTEFPGHGLTRQHARTLLALVRSVGRRRYGLGMGTFTWVEKVATQRGWKFATLERSSDVAVSGIGSGVPWECVLAVSGSAGALQHAFRWTMPIVSAVADGAFSVAEVRGRQHLFGSVIGPSGSSADLVANTAAIVGRLLKRQARGPQPLVDIESQLEIVGPSGLLSGDLLQRVAHWPTPPTNVLAKALAKADGALSNEPIRPPDAPPARLRLAMTSTDPLTVVSDGWWDRPSWLEHQVDLGVDVGAALVRSGFALVVP
jgi:hypothetical protein